MFLALALSLTSQKRIHTPESQVPRKGIVDGDMIMRTIIVINVFRQITDLQG